MGDVGRCVKTRVRWVKRWMVDGSDGLMGGEMGEVGRWVKRWISG